MHSERNTRCSVVEICGWWNLQQLHVISNWKSLHYFAYSVKEERNVAYTWVMVMIRLILRTLWFLEGSKTIFAIKMTKAGFKGEIWVKWNQLQSKFWVLESYPSSDGVKNG